MSTIPQADASPLPERGAPQMQAATALSRKSACRVVSLPEFERECAAQPSAYVVDTLIAEASVCIAVGDSGLGKSPWAYQLGMCVASGKPFLGHPVKQGRV